MLLLSLHISLTKFKNKIRIFDRFATNKIDEKIGKWENGKINGWRSARPMLLYTYNEKYRVTDGELIALKFHAFKLWSIVSTLN